MKTIKQLNKKFNEIAKQESFRLISDEELTKIFTKFDYLKSEIKRLKDSRDELKEKLKEKNG